jgi:hypothetical protein
LVSAKYKVTALEAVPSMALSFIVACNLNGMAELLKDK